MYALAKTTNEPMLFVGNDFSQTDNARQSKNLREAWRSAPGGLSQALSAFQLGKIAIERG